MDIQGIEIKVGQVWRTAFGQEVTIERNPNDTGSWPWLAVLKDGGHNVMNIAGKFYGDRRQSDRDLDTLISDPVAVRQPEVAAGQAWHYLHGGQTRQYIIESVGPYGARTTCGALLNVGLLREMGTCVRPAPSVTAVQEHVDRVNAGHRVPEQFLERDLGDTDFIARSQAAFVATVDDLKFDIKDVALGQQVESAEDIDILDIFGEAANDENHPYHLLVHVMLAAFAQAALGKGKERHASGGTPFHEQPMATINRQLGSVDGFIYQAHKKSLEAKRLPDGRAQAELLGSINYLAGAVIALDTWAKKAA